MIVYCPPNSARDFGPPGQDLLMPTTVHLILIPATADGLARAIGKTHRHTLAFVTPVQCCRARGVRLHGTASPTCASWERFFGILRDAERVGSIGYAVARAILGM